MRSLRIVAPFGLIGLFLVGCAASSAGSRAAGAFTPTPLAMDFTPTPIPRASTPTKPRQGEGATTPMPIPTASPAGASRPQLLPSGFSIAPNWLVLQPMRNEFDLGDQIWLTDGQHWIGPFPVSSEPIVDEDFALIRRDGEWEACWRRWQGKSQIFSCAAPLPGEPSMPRNVLEASCKGDIAAATVPCDLPPGMPASQVEVPNPFQGLKEGEKLCLECWVEIRIFAVEGDSTMLAVVEWNREWGPEEVPPTPDRRLYVLRPGEAPQTLLPKEERKEAEIGVDAAMFSPDGRFVLIPDFSSMAGQFTTWIVSWPQGDRVNLPGVGVWLRPKPEWLGR